MPQDIKIPAVGESISSGLLAQWHKEDGQPVQAGEVLLTLETDKVATEVTAPVAGTLKIQTPAGTEVQIGAVVGQILEGAATPATPAAPAKPVAEKPTEKPKEKEKEKEREKAAPAEKPVATPAPKAESAPEPEPPKPALSIVPKQPAPAPAADQSGRTTRKRMTPLRRKIATHLVNAQHTAAILTTFNEVDMTEVMALRKQLQDSFVARHGVKLGFMSFFIKAVVDALKSVPQVNGRIEGEDIIENHYYDVGVAIGSDRGLVVPVLHDCDKKGFGDLEREILDFAGRAKVGKILFEELQGGVITISNGGVYGSLLSTPILNPPQSAILGLHAIKERPVAVNGKVEIRPMMYLALSYDHRLIDGREAVTFLVRIKDCIEQPTRLLLDA